MEVPDVVERVPVTVEVGIALILLRNREDHQHAVHDGSTAGELLPCSADARGSVEAWGEMIEFLHRHLDVEIRR